VNGLSEIPMSEEANLVDEDSLKATIPVVWQILKSILFASTLILQELMSRVAESPALCDSESRSDLDCPPKLNLLISIDGPMIASKVLHVLRGFYFITSRLGPNAFSSYNFVYFAAIDILSSYPAQAEEFVKGIVPTEGKYYTLL
jgi:hypothetical protein